MAAPALERAAFGALVALALSLPFELKTPLVAVGPLSITNVELVMYVAVALWGARTTLSVFAPRRSRKAPCLWSIAASALVLAMCLSTAFAPTEARAHALKFTFRTLGGVLVVFAARDLVRNVERARTIALALAIGATIAAAAACAEVWFTTAARWLTLFKTQPSLAGGLLRASGTFQYANTAAMFWEGTLPFAVGALAAGMEPRTFRIIVALAIPLVIAQAVVLTASRAAIGVLATLLAAVALIDRRGALQMRNVALATVSGMVLLAVVHPGGSLLGLRLRQGDQATWYRAAYADAPSLDLQAGRETRVQVTVRNEGAIAWDVEGPRAVFLSYHWSRVGEDKVLIFEGARTPLPRTVAPGQEVTVDATVVAPPEPGRYALRWDMVREHVFWFSTVGSGTGAQLTDVWAAGPKVKHPPLPPATQIVPNLRPPRRQLWDAALRMWGEAPLVGKGPDRFRFLYGHYIGWNRFDNRITANNLYLETAANLGLFGVAALALLLAAFVTAFRTAVRMSVALADATRAAMLLVSLAGVAAFLLHGVLDYFFEFTPTYGLFWLSAGVVAALTRDVSIVRSHEQ